MNDNPTLPTQESAEPKAITAAIILAALGYFVDIYDLILFGIVRVDSLRTLGMTGDEITRQGEFLLNVQMMGLLIGGIVWGILGDKRGRLSVLFGSIMLYSAANLANAFVNDITSYAVLRFVAGVGLAGELGAGVTLVAESMSKEKRGLGTTLIAAFGLLGALAAGFVGRMEWGLEMANWRVAYLVGGVMGLALLALRIGVYESPTYARMNKSSNVRRGDFLMLFRKRRLFIRYLRCILIGMPTWYAIGILVIFAPEFAREMHIKGIENSGNAIMCAYAGLSLGDLTSGLFSQWLRSRKRAILTFIGIAAAACFAYMNLFNASATTFYIVCGCIGFGVGYWALFVTTAAEQFGTNLRATVTTTVPNFVRGSVVLVLLLYTQAYGVLESRVQAATLVGILVFALAIYAWSGMKESFHSDLDFIEEH
jgi:MFS transporter, putative metabolite:H+ symporter